MGIIVGRKTYLECNRCKDRSVPMFDQTKAVTHAEKHGWYKNQINGETICPKCRDKYST